MKRSLSVCAVLAIIVFGVQANAQQKPAAAVDRATAEKAAADAATKQAAEIAAAQAEAAARAQQKVAEEARRRDLERARDDQAKASVIIPVDVEVVISRYQNDKKTSSLPYALTVNTVYTYQVDQAPLTSLRMGGEVPLPVMSTPIGPDGKPVAGFTGGGPVQYKAVGTNIDARGRILQDNRFEVWVSVQDDAIATPQTVGAGSSPSASLPVIRTFRASNNLVLRDGQTRQFTAAADRITGEVVKVDVTLRVAK
jgi:hypothetical protein